MFYLIRLAILSRYVGVGRALTDLQQQASKLTMDNQLLENEIAKESSLKHLSEEASKAGFVAPEKILYIK